jgi:pimeloyl-ACP methyl ester carboxylesterase
VILAAAALMAGLQTKDCNVNPLGAATCGTYQVYENRRAQSGRIIALNFIAFTAAKPSKNPPIFFLAGGPGQGSTAIDTFPKSTISRLHHDYDLVFVDQRGTGKSNALTCSMYSTLDSHFERLFPTDAVRECRAELRERADLSLYGTDLAADDLNDVRVALGYDKINLYGVSYGSQLGFVYLRRHGDSVHGAIFIGVDPPGPSTQLYTSLAAQRGFDAVVRLCAKDLACALHFPNLSGKLATVLKRLSRSDAVVTLHDPSTHAPLQIRMNRGAFVETLHHLLYSDDTIALVPAMVDAASRGNLAPFAYITILFDNLVQQNMALGFTLSATCAEQIPFVTDAAMTRASAHTFLGKDFFDEERSACTVWQAQPVATDYGNPVHTTVPVLMISGSDDPATYPQNAADLLAFMPNAAQIVVPRAQHIPAGICVDDLIESFLGGTPARSLTWSCEQPAAAPDFASALPQKLQDL